MRDLAKLFLLTAFLGACRGSSPSAHLPDAAPDAAPVVAPDAAPDALHKLGIELYAYPVGPATVNGVDAGTYPNIFVSGTAPSGTAGGDLSGTYPNPGVAQYQGGAGVFCSNGNEMGAIVSSPATGYYLGKAIDATGWSALSLGYNGVSGTCQAAANHYTVAYDGTNVRLNSPGSNTIFEVNGSGNQAMAILGVPSSGSPGHVVFGGTGGVQTNVVFGTISNTLPSDSGGKGITIWESAGVEPTCTTSIQSMMWTKAGTGDIHFCNGATGVNYTLDGAALVPGSSPQFLQTATGPTVQWSTMSGDCTLASGGAITCTKVNGVSIGGTAATGKIPIASSASVSSWTVISGDSTLNSSGAMDNVSAANGAVVFGSSFVQVGASSTSATGDVRHPNAVAMETFRNAANSADVPALTSDASNNVILGGSNGADIEINNNGTIRYLFDTTAAQLFATALDLGGGSGILSLGAVTTVPPALGSTSIGLYNGSGQVLGINGLGINFPNTVTGTVLVNITPLASTSGGSGSAGQALNFRAQNGQAATGATNNGGTGGIDALLGGIGGSSALAAGGTGGQITIQSGAGGAATGGTGNGGNSGDVAINVGAGGASSGGTAGTPGIIHMQRAGADVATFANAGLGVVDTTVSTTSGTVTLTALQSAKLRYQVTPTLAADLTLVFPASTAIYWVDISNMTFSAHNLILKCGSGTNSVTLSALTTNQNLLTVSCATNVVTVNL